MPSIRPNVPTSPSGTARSAPLPKIPSSPTPSGQTSPAAWLPPPASLRQTTTAPAAGSRSGTPTTTSTSWPPRSAKTAASPETPTPIKRAQAEARRIEIDYGLRRVTASDGAAAKRPTRAETEKAHRTGRQRTPREQLRATIRTVIAVSTSPEEFFRLLTSSGITAEILRMPSGDIRGYKVALDGDTNAEGQPIWFAGSTLAPDLLPPDPQAPQRR